MPKIRKKVKRLNDLIKWRIEMLAKFGGFSRRYIASQVFGADFRTVSKEEIASVSSYLSRHKIRLKDWRNGLSVQAQSYAKEISTPKRKKRYRMAAARKTKVA